MWESRVSGSERGRRFNCDMVAILWHRRESRRQTEKTNFDLQSREAPAYSKKRLPPRVLGFSGPRVLTLLRQ